MKAIKIRAALFRFLFHSCARSFSLIFFRRFSSLLRRPPPTPFAHPPNFFPFYSLPELVTPIRLARARPATSLRFSVFFFFPLFSPVPPRAHRPPDFSPNIPSLRPLQMRLTTGARQPAATGADTWPGDFRAAADDAAIITALFDNNNDIANRLS